jgi:hypothetical protein
MMKRSIILQALAEDSVYLDGMRQKVKMNSEKNVLTSGGSLAISTYELKKRRNNSG